MTTAMSDFYNGKEILLLGGTGSLGKALTRKIKAKFPNVKGIRIFSRDEYKQWSLKKELEKECISSNVSFLIGDVRDVERLRRAFVGVDIVINCAAMKHVGACELNPIEAVQTNIDGAKNIITAALDCRVECVIHVSTDKAVYPVNLYGATKAVAEKLFLDSTIYRGSNYKTKFACVRYGNVYGSRGSLIELIKNSVGPIPITDVRMTRFFVTLDSVTEMILNIIPGSSSGCIYIPEMRAAKIVDIVNMIAPGRDINLIGIQNGEKLHECIMSKDELANSKPITVHGPIYQEVDMSRKQMKYACDCFNDLTSDIVAQESPITEEHIKSWE